MITAIIPAGGLGKRLGAQIPKQFLPLLGKPLILWTLEAFEKAPSIGEIVIPVLSGWEEKLKNSLEEAGLKKLWRLVPGGKNRQESVLNGLLNLSEETEIVLVHDAARALVTPTIIEEVIQAIRRYGAALAATRVHDTVKEVEGRRILRTLPRERIFLAQTPQGARFSLLKEAYLRAQKEGFVGTDEASLLERLNIPVFVVPSPPTNLKITTYEDLEFAEFLLRKRLSGPQSPLV